MNEIDLTDTTLYVQRALWEQQPLIETAQRYGATVVAVDTDEDAAGGQLADEFVRVDSLRDVSACLDVAAEYDVDAVATDQCDFSLFTTAYIGARRGHPAPTLGAVQRTTNKKRMRRAAAGDVAQPEYRICATVEEVRSAARETSLPVVVKPVDSRGAFGVRRLTDLGDVADAYLDAIANSDARELIVEEFIEGTPVTVDGYCLEEHRSLATASKDTPLGNLDPDRELTYPAQISEQKRDEVKSVTDSLASTLNLSFGPTHAEYILTDDGEFYLLEFHNRGGGLQTSASLVPAMTGFDVSTQILCDALGLESGQRTESFPRTRAGIIRPIQFDPGTVAEVRNLSVVRDREDVLVVQLFVEPGDEISEFELATKSHGAIVTVGDTVEAAESLAATVEQTLSVRYE